MALGLTGLACVLALLGSGPLPTREDVGLQAPEATAGGARSLLPALSLPIRSAVASPAPSDQGDAEDLRDLQRRALAVPVLGIERAALRDHWQDARDGGRLHQGIDIMAPRGTPVVAVEDGTVARLFDSRAGGLTVYLFGPGGRFVYYYAHLDRYAPGLAEGQTVRRGQVLGHVGASGNASPDAPHLHFEIGRLNAQRQWWRSAPLNPFLVLGPAAVRPTTLTR